MVSDKRTRVFAWVTGQQSNVGDSLLRRPYLRELAAQGEVDVWVRGSHDAFLSGVDVPPGATVRRSFIKWYAAMLRSTAPVLLALNAGQAPTGRFSFIAAYALRFACSRVRARGGRSVWMGAAIPGGLSRMNAVAYASLARAVDTVTWREPGSLPYREDAAVQPDWAFVEGSEVASWAEERDVLAVVMRGDRPNSDQWVTWAKQLAGELGLRPVVVVQVEGDASRAEQLAFALGGEVFPWASGRSHAEQEQLVRSVYSRAGVTIGDRLHGLVIAATEGSVPLGWVPTSSGKISRHFAPTGLDWVAVHEGSAFMASEVPTADQIAAYRSELGPAIERVRSALRDSASLLGRGD